MDTIEKPLGGMTANRPARMPKSAKSRGKVAPAKLAHIVLRTSMERVKPLADWYCKVLEAEATIDTDQFVAVTYDQEHHRIAILGIPGAQPHVDGLWGLHHIAFTYASLGDLLKTWRRLKGMGIEPGMCINHGPTTSMYFFDPDKNQIELQCDNVPESQFAAYFETDEFTSNPIGVKFDPAELEKRLAAGEAETKLLKRPAGAPPPISEFPVN